MERFARILVVDDQPDIREALGAHLERSGFDVLLAENAAAARNTIVSETVDLVVLDIMMPRSEERRVGKEGRSRGSRKH